MGRCDILGVGAVSAVGLDAWSTAAAVRAGVAGFRESELFTRHIEPLVMATVPDEHLEPLRPDVAAAPGLTPRACRMIQLAAPALREAAAGRAMAGVPLLLGLPEGTPADLLELICLQAGVPLDVRRSAALPHGRAAGLVALGRAAELLGGRTPEMVLVGGVDTYYDGALLAELEAEGRVLVPDGMDGFIPGEGAAFLLLARSAAGDQALASVLGAGTGEERGHLYSGTACTGEGLCAALDGLAGSEPVPASPTVLAGLNGENVGSREWGIAAIRRRALFGEPLRMEHPADCLGDIGAALGAMLLVIAAIATRKRYLATPIVVWASSDREARGAALVASPMAPPSAARGA